MSNARRDSQRPVPRAPRPAGHDGQRRSVLIVLAHPAMERSRVNRPLIERAATLAPVTVLDLYERYPDFDIDIDAEQAALSAAEVIVFQHPLLWYSVPALLRQWQDLVLEYGFAYGRSGNQLCGKHVAHCITSGGSQADYAPGGVHRCRLEEYLLPLRQTAAFCGLRWLPPYLVQGARRIQDSESLDAIVEDYARTLLHWSDRNTDLAALSWAADSEGPAHG